MKIKSIILCMAATIVSGGFLSSCKQKKQDEDIIVEKIVEKPQTQAVSMPETHSEKVVEWVGGAKYTYSVNRMCDTELSDVESHDVVYHDNSIELIILRNDGTAFLEKTITKGSFSGLLNNEMKQHGVLLSLALDKTDANNMYFVAGIGSPDESYEDFVLVQLVVSRMGDVSVATYTPPEVEAENSEE